MNVYVDMDGTFLVHDTLWERVRYHIASRPILAFRLLIAMLRGRLFFKNYVDDLGPADDLVLRENSEVLAALERMKKNGCKIYLISASSALTVRETYEDHRLLFDDYFCSTSDVNLKGARKLEFMRSHANEGFYYIGDSFADLPIFKAVERPVVVGFWSGVIRWVLAKIYSKNAEVLGYEGQPKRIVGQLFALVRARQWLKNLLVFVPLITGSAWNQPAIWLDLVWVFLGFCCVASLGYIFNDLSDADKDRLHPRKARRPIASGSIPYPVIAAVSLLLLSFFGSIFYMVSPEVGLMLSGYLALSILYSKQLKRILVLDVFVLTAFYLIRLIVGVEAVDGHLTVWFGCFFYSVFFSLALLKRYSEVKLLATSKQGFAGALYQKEDEAFLISAGMAGALLSAIVLVVYGSGYAPENLYSDPRWLFGVSICLMYFFCDLWIQGGRGKVKGDPLDFAATRRSSFLVVAVSLVFYILALGGNVE